MGGSRSAAVGAIMGIVVTIWFLLNAAFVLFLIAAVRQSEKTG
jgi:uncharacterized protein YqgC (DUF456 family)